MSDNPTASRVVEREGAATRVLHTSDWHLGVTVRGVSRAQDHDAVIAEIVEIAATAEPDLIVHTGDLFDSARPTFEEFRRAIWALRDLAKVAPVLLISGNHDNVIVLEALADAVEDGHRFEVESRTYDPYAVCQHRIRIHPKPTTPEAGAVTTYPTRAGGVMRVAALPFVHANRTIKAFDELLAPNATYNDRVRAIIGLISKGCFEQFDPTRDVAMFASHVHAKDARTSSEKVIHIADDYATDTAHIDEKFGYVAFGHIHVPQPVANGQGSYAGSILEVNFGEEGETKRVVIADLTPSRPTITQSIPLTAGRRLHRVRSPLSLLADHVDAIGAGIVDVTITVEPANETGSAPVSLDDGIMLDGVRHDSLSSAVRSILPDATIVGISDGRNPHVVVSDELELPTEMVTIEDSFRKWLIESASPLFSKPAHQLADPTRAAELFEQFNAASITGAVVDLAEIGSLTQLEENL